MQKRNGEIDVLRFVFSLFIVIAHFSSSFNFVYLKNGWIGVEFFFLTAGLFMAKSAKNIHVNKDGIADQTWKFLIHKVKSFYIYFIVSVVLNVLIRYIFIQHKTISQIWGGAVKSIPTFGLFFFGTNSQDIGLNVPNTWFLSAMMISCLILYPLFLWNYHCSVKIVIPIVAIVLFGYLFTTQRTLALHGRFGKFITLGILRAIAEMGLGAILYELSGCIKRHNISGTRSKIVSVIKYFCYLQTILFTFRIYESKSYSLHAMLFCAIGLLVTYSERGIYIHSNSFTTYLGRISLPIFMFHGIFRHAAREYYGDNISIEKYVVLIGVSIVICILLMHIIDLCRRKVSTLWKH